MRIVWLALLVGCGRIAFDPLGAGDSGTGDSGTGDAGTTGVFAELELPSGGEAMSIAAGAGPLARVYVGYKGGRVFRSDDGAVTWSECGRLLGDPIHLALAADGTFYSVVATNQTQFSSRRRSMAWSADDCATFTLVPSPGNRELNGIAATPTQLLAATSTGLWSWDVTAGWALVASPFDAVYVNDVKYDGRIVVAAQSGVGTRTGTTWVTMAIGDTSQVAIAASDAMRLYATGNGMHRSLDGGMSWTQLRTGYFDLIAVDPADAQRLITMSGGALHQSLDGGAVLSTEARKPVMANAWPTDALFDPGGSGRLLLSSWHGLFEAASSTLDWTRADIAISAWDVEDVAEVAGTRYVATTGGLWVSDNNGPWRISATTVAQSSIIWSLAVGATDPNRVYVMGDSFARSGDRGTNFTVMLPSAALDGWGFSTAIESGGRVWAGSDARAIYSDNDGMTWIAGNLGAANRAVRELVVRAGTVGPEVVAATTSGVFWSLDGGVTYVASTTGLTNLDLIGAAELGDGRIVLAARDGVWITTARGSAWTRIGFANEPIYDVLVIDTRLFIATDNSVLVTADVGTTWTELPGLAGLWPRSLARGENNTLLVGTQGHGLYRTPLP